MDLLQPEPSLGSAKNGAEEMVALDDELEVEPDTCPATSQGAVPPLEERQIEWDPSSSQPRHSSLLPSKALPSSKGAPSLPPDPPHPPYSLEACKSSALTCICSSLLMGTAIKPSYETSTAR